MTKLIYLIQILAFTRQVAGLGKLFPTEYSEGETLPILVSQIESHKVNVPYNYYDVGTCRNEKHRNAPYVDKNWGEALSGELWQYSPYEVKIKTEKTKNSDPEPGKFQCKVLCEMPFDAAVRNRYNMMSHNQYFYRLMVDDLPSATLLSPKITPEQPMTGTFASGVPDSFHLVGIGDAVYDDGLKVAQYYLHKKEIRVYNHLEITVEVHQGLSDKFRIVGFEVEPKSIDWEGDPCHEFEDKATVPYMAYKNDTNSSVVHTYSVRIKKSEAKWADRFDHYIKTGSSKVHHAQFFISVSIAVVSVLIVRCCIYRIVAKDFGAVKRNQDKLKKARDQRRDQVSNSIETESKGLLGQNGIEDESETMRDLQKMFKGLETVNWTKLSGDVFRAPPLSLLYSTLIGIGSQCITISFIMVVLISYGNFLSAELRDYIYMLFYVLSAFTGTIAGYVSSRLYKFFNGTNWLVSFYLTGAIIPLCVSIALIANDVCVWLEKSQLSAEYFAQMKSDAGIKTSPLDVTPDMLPQSSTTFLYSIWLCFNIPSVGFGAYRGFAAPKIKVPVRISRIEREIPEVSQQPCHSQSWFTLLFGSLLISLCVISEIYYIVTSVWRHHYYFMFGYLGLSLLIMSFVAWQVSTVQTYWTLNSGNYNWWWRSFFVGYLVGAHIFFLLSWWGFFREANDSILVLVSYCIQASMMCSFVGIMAATFSFAGSWYFIQHIYRDVHQEQKGK